MIIIYIHAYRCVLMIIIYIDAYRCVLIIIIRFLAFKKIDRYKVGWRAAYTTTHEFLKNIE